MSRRVASCRVVGRGYLEEVPTTQLSTSGVGSGSVALRGNVDACRVEKEKGNIRLIVRRSTDVDRTNPLGKLPSLRFSETGVRHCSSPWFVISRVLCIFD